MHLKKILKEALREVVRIVEVLKSTVHLIINENRLHSFQYNRVQQLQPNDSRTTIPTFL